MPRLLERYWTADDVRALPDDGNRYECIDGALLMTPSPRRGHQGAVLELLFRLGPYVLEQKVGKLLLSPADIELEPGTLVQPDIFVAVDKDGAQPPLGWSDIELLLLSVEVLSPSTANRDRTVKREFYQRAGVGETWILDIDARTVERWKPSDPAPEILTATLSWAPEGSSTPLLIDLPEFFESVAGPRATSA